MQGAWESPDPAGFHSWAYMGQGPGEEGVCAGSEVECHAVPVILTSINSTLNPEERSCDTRGSNCFHKFRKDSEMGLDEGGGGG